ncbi:MAG: MFS transporter [Thermomicrobiales bacterium]
MNPLQLWRTQGTALRAFLLYQFLAFLGTGIYALLFNLYLLALGYREDMVGLTSGLNTLAQGIAALLMSTLIRRLGTNRTMIGALALFALTSAGQAIVSGRPALVTLAFLSGAATSGLTVPLMPFIADEVAPEMRGEAAAFAFALQNVAITVGTFAGGVLPALLLRAGFGNVARNRTSLLIGVAISALGLLPLLLIAQRSRRAGHEPTGALLGPQLNATPRRVRRAVWGFAGAAVLLSIGAGAFIPFVNVYLVRLGASESAVGTILALTGAAGAILSLVAPALLNRLGSLPSVLVLRVLPAPVGLLLALFPSLGLVVGTQAVRGIGASMAWPVEMTIFNKRVPANAMASAFGLRIAAWNFSWAATSIIAGELIIHGGYNAPLYILAVFTTLGTALLWYALR